MAAKVGQGIQVDIAHQVDYGELPGFAGQYGNARDLAVFVADPYLDVFTVAAALDADDTRPFGRLNPTFGSSHSASSAYQNWPTWLPVDPY